MLNWINNNLCLTAVLTFIVLVLFIGINVVSNCLFSLKLDYQFGISENRYKGVMSHVQTLYGKTSNNAMRIRGK